MGSFLSQQRKYVISYFEEKTLFSANYYVNILFTLCGWLHVGESDRRNSGGTEEVIPSLAIAKMWQNLNIYCPATMVGHRTLQTTMIFFPILDHFSTVGLNVGFWVFPSKRWKFQLQCCFSELSSLMSKHVHSHC